MISLLKKPQVKTIQVSSVADLKEQLRQVSFEEQPLLHLVVHDAQIVLRPFCIKEAMVPNAIRKLRLEVVELIGLPLEEFQLAIQVLKSPGKFVSGIYMTATNKKLQEYFEVLDEARLAVCRMSTPVIEQINDLYRQLGGFSGRICLVDISLAGKAAISVFSGEECELVREIILGESLSVLKNEIIQSLRSVCAKSEHKNVDKIFIAGEGAGTDDLAAFIEQQFHLPAQKMSNSHQVSIGDEGQNFIRLNLAENHSLTYNVRRNILVGSSVLILFLFLFNAIVLTSVVMKGYQIQRARATFSEQQYQYAVDIYNKAKEGNHAK